MMRGSALDVRIYTALVVRLWLRGEGVGSECPNLRHEKEVTLDVRIYGTVESGCPDINTAR